MGRWAGRPETPQHGLMGGGLPALKPHSPSHDKPLTPAPSSLTHSCCSLFFFRV
jgi:hypothetical protein